MLGSSFEKNNKTEILKLKAKEKLASGMGKNVLLSKGHSSLEGERKFVWR